MKLPTRDLVRILGSTDVYFSGGGKRRLAGRTPLSLFACVSTQTGNPPLDEEPAIITDISALGVGLVLKRDFKPGEKFTLRLSRHDAEPLSVKCLVQRCSKDHQEGFQIGAEFLAIEG